MKIQQQHKTSKTLGIQGTKEHGTNPARTSQLTGLKAPSRSGKTNLETKAATKLLRPVSQEDINKPALQKQAKLAREFTEVLAPYQSVGFRFSLEGYQELPPATKEVLNTFSRMREMVSKIAGAYGVGQASFQTVGNDLHPKDVDDALNDALKPFKKTADDALSLLKTAAKRSGDELLRAHLNVVVGLWEGRESNPAWKAAQTLRPVTPPPPRVVSSSENRQVLLQSQAQQEWDNAPRARGYRAEEGFRELLKDYVWERNSPRPDVRAFTFGMWMDHRVAQLTREADNVRIPDWRL